MALENKESDGSRQEETCHRLSIRREVSVEIRAADRADLKQPFTSSLVSLTNSIGNGLTRQRHVRVVEGMPTQLTFRPALGLQAKSLKTSFHRRLTRHETTHSMSRTLNGHQLVKQKQHATTLRKHGCVIVDQCFKAGLRESATTQLIRKQLGVSTGQPNAFAIRDGFVFEGREKDQFSAQRSQQFEVGLINKPKRLISGNSDSLSRQWGLRDNRLRACKADRLRQSLDTRRDTSVQQGINRIIEPAIAELKKKDQWLIDWTPIKKGDTISMSPWAKLVKGPG